MSLRHKILLLILAAIMVQGCIRVIFGIRKEREYTGSQLMHHAKKWGMDLDAVYTVQSDAYEDFLKTNPAYTEEEKKFLRQPLQWRFYDSTGTLTALLPNCLVGGFPNLKWDNYQRLDQYPPAYCHQFKNTAVTLADHSKFYEPLASAPYPGELKGEVVAVHWSVMMGRHTRIMMKHFKEYMKKFERPGRRIIFVNMDNLFYP